MIIEAICNLQDTKFNNIKEIIAQLFERKIVRFTFQHYSRNIWLSLSLCQTFLSCNELLKLILPFTSTWFYVFRFSALIEIK